MHAEAAEFIGRARMTLRRMDIDTAGWKVVEVGARDINGRASDYWNDYGSWFTTDIAPGPNVDMVGDGVSVLMRLQDDDEEHWVSAMHRFNLAVCAEVFEHTADWRDILDEMLNTAEYALVTCASTGREPHSAVDGFAVKPGEWYQNVSVLDMGMAMATMKAVPILLEFNPKSCDLYALCTR
jgi:hypothetical protein